MDAEEQTRTRIAELTDAAWTLAAVAALLRRPADPLGPEHGAVPGMAGLAEQTAGGTWIPSRGLAELLTDDRRRAPHVTRTPHKLFQSQDLTVAGWIRRHRLENFRRDLAEPYLRSRPLHAGSAPAQTPWG